MAPPATPGSSLVDGEILETHKENIVPSRDGRSAVAISQLYSVPRAQRSKELAAMHGQYRDRIDAIKEDDFMNDEDPVDLYCQYVTWIMNNYPSGSSSESGLVSVLEEATRRFSDEPVYKNDKRYVRLWVEYANLVEQSERVYAFMLANDIGSSWPHVYEEYALILERNKNMSKADKVYRLAINRKVSGLAALKLRYKEFQARCLTLPTNDGHGPPASVEPARPAPGGRAILGSRVPSGQPVSSQSLAPRTPGAQPGPRSNLGRIAVFKDSHPAQEDAQTNEWPQLPTKAEATKENQVSAVEGAIHQRAIAPRTPKVTIFRDPSTTPATTSVAAAESPEHVFRPKAPTSHQELNKDPLRNFGPHCKFDLDLPAIDALLLNDSTGTGKTDADCTMPSGSQSTTATVDPKPAAQLVARKGSTSSSPSTRPGSVVGSKPKPSLPLPLPGKQQEIAAFDIAVVWHDDDEYCRWETRARADGLLGKKWAAPSPEETKIDDLVVPLKEKSQDQTINARRTMAKMRQSTTGKLISSPTTNTKAALNDVFDMFNMTARIEDALEEEDEMQLIGASRGGRITDVPATPTPLTLPAKKLAWTPPLEKDVSKSTGLPPPLRLDRLDTLEARPSSVNPCLEVTKETQIGMEPPASSSTKFTVFQEIDVNNTPAPSLQAGIATGMAPTTSGSGSAKTPGKFAVFQENGEKRLPSVVKPVPTVGTTPLAQKPLSFKEERRVSSPTEQPSAAAHLPLIPSDADGPAAQPYSNRRFFRPTPTGSPLSQSAEAHDIGEGVEVRGDGPHPQPLVFREVGPNLRASTNTVSGASPYDDVFTNGEPDGDGENGDIVEEGVEDSYVEDELGVADIHPRSYEMRGGVAIMTPITERTLEYETHTRSSSVGSSRSLAAPIGAEGERILDGLDASPRSSRRRSSARPSLTTRRRSSIRPRAPTIEEDANEEQDAYLNEPINPFKSEYVQAMLDAIWSNLDRTTYHDLRHAESANLDEFEAFAKKRSSKARLGRSRSEPPIPPMMFELGDAEYTLLDKIGEGGFGAVFLAEDPAVKELAEECPEDYLPGYELVAIKTVRPSMLWEFAVLHVIRSSLPQVALSSIIAPREFYHFSNESHLVMDYSGQGTLLDAVNHAAHMGVNAQDTSGIDELLIMFFAIELIRLVRFLHGEHFIHGDLKIDNCLLRLADPADTPLEPTYDHTGEGGWAERGIKLIDFGRTIDVGLFEPGQAFMGDWPTDARDCIEMREGRPWTYQTDYAGLAGIIYCMMFGKYIETAEVSKPDGIRRFKVATPLKRYWQTDIWNRVFNILLNPTLARHDGTLPLVDELGVIEDDMADFLASNCERKGKSLKKMLNQMHQYTKNNSLHVRK